MATSPTKKTLSSQSSSANRPPHQNLKFARRTSSGRIVSLSRDDDLDMSGEFSGQNDYINYTVMMPPTPDNQPGDTSDSKTDVPGPYGMSRFRSESQDMDRKPNGEGGGNGGGAKMDRRISVMKSSNSKSMLLRSQTADFDHNRWLFETKGKYGIGNAFWSNDEDDYVDGGMSMQDFMDKPWKPLTRKLSVPAGVLSPYRCIYIASSSGTEFYYAT